MTDHWLQSAEKYDVLVVELLLRIKHSSDSDSISNSPRAPPPETITTTIRTVFPPRWGHRKNRSKSTAPATTAVTKEQRGSPTTHLSWSGGAGSTSDGSDESSRPSDLSSAGRSVKSSIEVKDEESSLLNERIHINKKLTSMGTTRLASCGILKRAKVDSDQNEIHVSCRVEAPQRGFVLPDLNLSLNEEDLQFL